ncbi:MAG: aspartate 1-decarboxylase [Dissulfuribacterales bacterium]
MLRSMLKSKIHRATVTQTALHYEGSLSLDKDLIEAAQLLPFEQIMVYNISNGERFDTYVIEAERGSGTVCLNGAAARKGEPGDLIIIASYGLFDKQECLTGESRIVAVDSNNRITDVMTHNWSHWSAK